MALTKIKLNTMVTGNLPDANIPNNITVDTASAVPASGITGNTLASGITASSLTSVGTLTGLTVAGNIGIGVSPSATHTSHDSLNIGGNGYWASFGTQGASGEMDIGHNFYYAQSGHNVYISTDEATRYRQGSGKHVFATAASGSAGSNITFSDVLTLNADTSATFAGKVSMGDAGLTSANEFPVNIDINSSTTQQIGLEVRQHTSGNDNRMRFKNANGQYVRFGQSSNGDFFLEPFNSGYNKVFTVKTTGMTRIEGKDSGSRTTGDDDHRTLSLGGRPSSNNYVTLGFDSGNTYRGALDFKADSGDFSYWVNSGGTWLQSFSIANNKDISTFGVILADQSSTSDFGNTAFKTIDGNDMNGVRILHGGGKGQILLYDGNNHRGTMEANKFTCHTNGQTLGTTANESVVILQNNGNAARISTSKTFETYGGFYSHAATGGYDHGLITHTNEFNPIVNWQSGYGRVHFSYRANNTFQDWTFYNGSSGGYTDLEAAAFNVTSDYRLKKTVTDFTTDVCDSIKDLRPVTYFWKANTKMHTTKQIGFLAHELQEKLPLSVKGEKDAINEKGDIDPQTIKTEALATYIIKGMQEIIKRLEALEAN